jgi:tetratricopeptide (TPR) repeat protein
MHVTLRAFAAVLLCAFALGASAQTADTAETAIARIGHEWAQANYGAAHKNPAAFDAALADARRATAEYPARAEPRIWQAIVLASIAGREGGFGALGKAKEARGLLLEAEKIDPSAMEGSVYTTLGSLYAKVPGWPIGFGDRKKAREYLERALAIDPAGIDANYFYADYLVDVGDYAGAWRHLEDALRAPPRPGREDADEGRRGEANAMLSMLHEKHASAIAAASAPAAEG